jgi:phage terminase large subunit-like protein
MSNLAQVGNQTTKSKRGGRRPGAGRPKKSAEELRLAGAQQVVVANRRLEEQEPVAQAPAPPPRLELVEFISRVKHERETFDVRLTPSETVVRLSDGEIFPWPDQHPITRMKAYAEGVVNGQIISGSLAILAAQRFLKDLETGAARGLFLDPLAVENIATWFTEFNVPDFSLQDWEIFLVGQAFGWKRPSGLRRFDEVWIEIARKNGKTCIMAALALFLLLADCEPHPEVYTCSNAKEQSRICYRAAKRMIDACDELGKALRVLSSAFTNGEGTYQPLSSEWKSMDGLAPSGGLFDEVHEFVGSDIVEKITTGMVARKQPLIFSCTTAGYDSTSYAGRRHEQFVKLLTDVAPDDSKLVFIAAIDKDDDWKKPEVWAKANPNLGVTVRVAALQQQIKEIEEDPSKLTPFLRYHCNSWVTTKQGHTLPVDKIAACAGPYNLKPIELRTWFLEHSKEWPAFGGFDLGVVEDMTAFVAFYPDVRFADTPSEQPPYAVAVPWFWIPEERVEEKKRLWNVPLDVWIRDGWVKTTPGNYVDVRAIKQDLKDILWTTGKFRDLGFDAWNAQVLMSELHDEKIAKCTRVPQHEGFLTAPAQELIRAVVQGRFVHLKNPVLVWQLGNVVLEPNDRGGIIAKKLSKSEKIDAVQALLSAMQRYLNPDDADKFRYTSVYNTRGVALI